MTLLGDKAFVVALLKHGIFDFSDLWRCAQALRQNVTVHVGLAQAATLKPKPELRQAALRARKQESGADRDGMATAGQKNKSCF